MLRFTANLDKVPNNGPVEVNFNISGTAQRDIDYIISNNLIIDGGTSGSFVISGLQDQLVEGTETIDLTISSVTNADYDVTYDRVTYDKTSFLQVVLVVLLLMV